MSGVLLGLAVYALIVVAASFFLRFWVLRWHLYIAAMIAIGGVLGALAFALFGPLFYPDRTIAQFLQSGLRDGAFFALIWAPGVSFVACVMQAHRRRSRS